MLIGECSEECMEVEGFCPFLVVTLIRKYSQAEGVKVHNPPVGNLEEMQFEPIIFLLLHHSNIQRLLLLFC